MRKSVCGNCGTSEGQLEDGTSYTYLHAGKGRSPNGVKIVPCLMCTNCRDKAQRVIAWAAKNGWLHA